MGDVVKSMPSKSIVALTSKTERPSIVVLIMNVSGPSGTGKTARRKRVIQKTILDTKPHVVLFQEFNWAGTSGKTWLDSALPKHYEYFIHQEASILIDNREVVATNIDERQIRQILERLQSNPNNNLNVAFPLDFTPFPRMAMKQIKGSKQDLKDILVVSWHGVWTNHGNTLTKRKRKFEYLMEFLRQIGKELDLPLIVAGDFNINFEDIVPLLPDPFEVACYTASGRRAKNGVKDHFIASKGLCLFDVQSIDLDRVSENDDPTAVLDHEPVKCKVVHIPSYQYGEDIDFKSKNACVNQLKEQHSGVGFKCSNDNPHNSRAGKTDFSVFSHCRCEEGEEAEDELKVYTEEAVREKVIEVVRETLQPGIRKRTESMPVYSGRERKSPQTEHTMSPSSTISSSEKHLMDIGKKVEEERERKRLEREKTELEKKEKELVEKEKERKKEEIEKKKRNDLARKEREKVEKEKESVEKEKEGKGQEIDWELELEL